MIEISGVAKSHGTLRVLDEISLTLPKGGVTSIIGPNGAGKSTLLSIIARLQPPDHGQVLVDGLDVAKTPGKLLARRLSVLRQDNHMSARLTVKDLVAFGRYPHNDGRPTLADRDHIDRALAYLDLVDLGTRFLDELSGGQRQRAFVAMTLCQDTDYMLLDEPLNSLDIHHAVRMMKLLKSAARDFDKTIVLVLHDINFASCYSDHIVAMRDGQVLYQGSPEVIIQPAVLAEVYDSVFEVHDIKGNRIVTYYSD